MNAESACSLCFCRSHIEKGWPSGTTLCGGVAPNSLGLPVPLMVATNGALYHESHSHGGWFSFAAKFLRFSLWNDDFNNGVGGDGSDRGKDAGSHISRLLCPTTLVRIQLISVEFPPWLTISLSVEQSQRLNRCTCGWSERMNCLPCSEHLENEH